MRKRILYITILDWSTGDELALRGTVRLMENTWPGHVRFLGDKSPEIRAGKGMPSCSDLWTAEKGDCHLDLIVHAGGNDWGSKNHEAWEAFADEHSVPTVYLGVGMSEPSADEARLRRILTASPLFVGRDDIAVKRAKRFGAQRAFRFCCPSLFVEGQEGAGNKIALVYQASRAFGPHSCGSDELWKAEIALFEQVVDASDVLILCFFIDDYIDALERFPLSHNDIVYSRVLEDYLAWYGECGRVISMRLHGAHLGAALGKPTVCVKTPNAKCCALAGIGVPLASPAEVNPDDLSCFSDPQETERLKRNYALAYARELGRVADALS